MLPDTWLHQQDFGISAPYTPPLEDWKQAKVMPVAAEKMLQSLTGWIPKEQQGAAGLGGTEPLLEPGRGKVELSSQPPG